MSLFRRHLIEKAVRRRFFVTLCGGEGQFSGVLVEFDDTQRIFDDVRLSTPEGEQKAAGRLYVDRVTISYMQELTAGG